MSATATATVKKSPAVTLYEFQAGAEDMVCSIAGQQFMLSPRQFSTGSYGYSFQGAPPSVLVKIGDKHVKLCVSSLNLVVANSKP